MSLAKKSFLTAVVAPIALAAFGLAASNDATAADQCLPGVYNAQRGVKGGDCYTTEELNKAMKSLGQRSLIVGDRIGFGENKAGVVSTASVNRFTSNEDGSLGFNVEGNAPSNQPSTQWGIGAILTDVRIYDRDRPVLPSVEAVGKWNAQGIQKSGDRLMLSAKYNETYMVVVARSNDPDVGSFLSANGQTGAGLAGLKNLAYTDLGKSIIRQQSNQQVSLLSPALNNK